MILEILIICRGAGGGGPLSSFYSASPYLIPEKSDIVSFIAVACLDNLLAVQCVSFDYFLSYVLSQHCACHDYLVTSKFHGLLCFSKSFRLLTKISLHPETGVIRKPQARFRKVFIIIIIIIIINIINIVVVVVVVVVIIIAMINRIGDTMPRMLPMFNSMSEREFDPAFNIKLQFFNHFIIYLNIYLDIFNIFRHYIIVYCRLI